MTDRRFLLSFVLLSLASGLTIGLGKVVTTLAAIRLGASPMQIGIVSAMESVGMVLVTVPAGFIIARYGARIVYVVASLGPLLVNLLMPLAAGWAALAAARFVIGLCIPFRIVSMNAAFLERLATLGQTKSGWYRGTQQAGMAIVGPALAGLIAARLGTTAAFLAVAALFGAMAAFSVSFMPERQPATPAGNLRGELSAILGQGDVAESCLVEFVSSATVSVFSTFIILLAATLPGLSEQDGIRVLLFQGVTAVAMLLAGGSAVARKGRRRAYALGLALMAAALATFGLAGGFAGLAAGAVLLSAGASIVHLVNVRVLAALPGGKSKVAGFYNLASMTGSSLGALSAGLISRAVPLQSVFLLWLPVLALGATLVALRGARPSLVPAEAR